LHIDPGHPENNRPTPRSGLRLCGVSLDDHFLVNAGGVAFARAVNLPDALIGPEYPNDVGARVDFSLPNTSLLGFGRISTGPFNTDAAPDREGWTTRVDVGVRTFSRSPYRTGFGAGSSEMGIGIGYSTMEGVEGGVARLFYFNRSDLGSYTHRVGGFALRASVSVFQGDASISLGSGPQIPGRSGQYNHLGDIFSFSSFIPLRLSLSFYWDPPSNLADASQDAAGISRASLSGEDIATRLIGRGINELTNFRRRETASIFMGVQMRAGRPLNNPQLYGLAGIGQTVMGAIEGYSRGSTAAEMGDLARHEAGNAGRWAIVGGEAALTLGYFLASAAAPSLTEDFDRAISETGYGSVRTGRWLQLGQAGLTALDAFGLTGDPETGGPLFHASNAGAALLGVLFVLFPRPISGNGYVNNAGIFDNSLWGDQGPFFDGTRGDIRRADFLNRRESMYLIHTSGMMSLGYALSREINWITYVINRGLAPTPAVRPASNGAAQSGREPGRQLNLGLQMLQGGGMFTASGSF